MSIYATLWALQFPRFGEFHIGCEWVTVIAQGVPAHVAQNLPTLTPHFCRYCQTPSLSACGPWSL
jgi:hypothetical protein